MTRLAHTRGALRRILPGLPLAFLRSQIQRTAETAAAEGIGSLAVFARVIDRHGERLDDDQLAGLAGALAEDLPLDLGAGEEPIATAVREAFDAGGAA